MSDPLPCSWRMPDDARSAPGAACVLDDGHEDAHVIAVTSGAGTRHVAAWFYRVDVVNGTMRAEVHADFRGPADIDDDELRALWAVMRAASET